MALDQPASGEALWALYQQTGIRPEYLIGVLQHESGLNPEADNGAGYYGVGQESAPNLAALGIDSQDYKTWPASRQISTVIAPRYRGLASKYGQLRSGARVYLGLWLPALLGSVTDLNHVIASRLYDPNNWYRDNPSLDFDKSGAITLSDLAAVVNASVSAPAARAAITQTYALRPGESPDPNPGLGQDFGQGNLFGGLTTGQIAALAGALVALAAAIVYSLPVVKPRTRRRRRLVYA